MLLKRITRIISKIITHPKILLGKIKGIYLDHCSSCLIAKKLSEKPIKTVIDVGANVGNFIKASKYIFPGVKVYAFEPVNRLYNKIKKIDGVTAFNFGLWDKNKEAIFYWNKKNEDNGSFLKPTEKYQKMTKTRGMILETKVKQRRFDKLNLEIKRPCFLKIDVEGGEDRVLRGFGKRLNEIDMIQIEFIFQNFYLNQIKLSEIMSILEKFGFSGFIQNEIDYIDNSNIPSMCDLIFFKKNKEKFT